MLGLPKSTEFNKRVPKQKFYENLSMTPTLKHIFIKQIEEIYWRNKIAATTMNLASGGIVTEIEVFEVKLTGPQLEESALLQMDRAIPYHIVFLLEYENKYQAWMAYKEATTGSNAFKIVKYYHTPGWLLETELPLKVDGQNMDAVYENFVRQIGDKYLISNRNEPLKDSVERDIRRQELQDQITRLEVKVHREKQFNKQVQLNEEVKRLRKELDELI